MLHLSLISQEALRRPMHLPWQGLAFAIAAGAYPTPTQPHLLQRLNTD